MSPPDWKLFGSWLGILKQISTLFNFQAFDIIIQKGEVLTFEDAFGELMATAGLSVQITLLASAVAFSLGAVTNLNSVRWFSAFATLNTVMIMILFVSPLVSGWLTPECL